MEVVLEKLKDLIYTWNPDPTNLIILKLFTTLATRLLSLNYTSWNPPETNITDIKLAYDYIVVGGGTAGLVVASLLSTNLNSRILLIEGGSNAPLTTEIPYYLPNIQNSKYDWNYKTIPQNGSCQGYEVATCHIPLGKMLGGSTLLRSMVYNTGTKRDWNRWENLGNPNWNWKTVFPYFINFIKKQPLENFESFLGLCNDKLKPLRNVINTAAKDLGFTTILDQLDSIIGKIGYGLSYGTLQNGKNNHPGKTYLKTAIENGNIYILKDSIVTEILIDSVTKKAKGIEFAVSGNEFDTRYVEATTDIILCAGAINNAKLLMLSGVGPKEHLDEKHIAITQRLEGVGENFHDHVRFPGIFHVIKQPGWQTEFDEVEAIEQFILKKQGPLTSIGISDLVGYIYSLPGERSDYPNIQMNHYYIYKNSPNSKFFTEYKFSKPVREYLQNLNTEFSILVQIPTLLKPKSRGRILLRNADPLAEPIIDPQYLTHPDDVVALIRAAKHAVAMGETESFRNVQAELINLPEKFCSHCSNNHTEKNCEWICLLKKFATSGGNPVGSTRMGKCAECSNAVVDHCLRVHGIQNLRVADASVMPEIISGDIYASNMVIAQRVAEFILNKDACN